MVGKRLRSLWQTLSARFAPAESDENDESLADVPSDILNDLQQQVDQLPIPQPYVSAVHEAFIKAFKTWHADPDVAHNILVVLSQPMEAIAPILKASFAEDIPDCHIQFLLDGYQRSSNPLDMEGHIRREIEPEATHDESDNHPPATSPNKADTPNDNPTVMVIPNLEQCFLRCIQGWEGIEYLQTFAAHDTSRFWVFGCNLWAWSFLAKVCEANAYMEHVIALPVLTDEELAIWLTKLVDTPLETPTAACSAMRVLANDDGHDYWQTLAGVAEGLRETASYLWVQSLRLPADAVTEEGALADHVDTLKLLQRQPKQPELMTLAVMDRYLIHSLLIHGEMTRSHLALSLGETERSIRSRIQILERAGVIVERGRRLSIQPAHYPKLCDVMKNNNFLIGEQ